jgi:hypothetical protein
MKVLLSRDLYLGEVHYKRSAEGNDLPDVLDGREIVLFKDWKGDVDKIPLPRDAVIFDEVTMKPPPTRGKKETPTALSEVTKMMKEPLIPVAETAKK